MTQPPQWGPQPGGGYPQPQWSQPPRKPSHWKMWLTAVVVGALVLVVPIVLAVFVFNKQSGGRNPATNGTGSASSSPTFPSSEEPPSAPPAGVGMLPPFNPPAGLGANCQYQPTPHEPAAKKANPPRAGTVPTDPAHV